MDKKVIFLLSGAAVLFLLLGGLFGYALSLSKGSKPAAYQNVALTNNSLVNSIDSNKNDNTNALQPIPSPTPIDNLNATNTTTGDGNVNTSLPTPEPSEEVEELSDLKLTPTKDFYGSAKYYKVMTLSEGKYKGADLILAVVQPEGPHFYDDHFRFVRQKDSYTLLSLYSDDPTYPLDPNKYIRDEQTVLKSLDFPDVIQGDSDRKTLERDPFVRAFFKAEGLKKVFTHKELGDVYTTASKSVEGVNGENGFYFEAPDHTLRAYSLKVDFFTKDNVAEVTWTGGAKNQNAYTFSDPGGCGMLNYHSVMYPGDIDKEKDLKQIGVNIKGDVMYELKDSNHVYLKEMYDTYQPPYDSNQEKVSYADFIKDHPMIFWVDPFGRLLRARGTQYIPQAECGKPVIYLYPEKEQPVSVTVEPRGGISVSDPAYSDGWDVIAKPSGELFDLGTRKSYPYLFWEGRSRTVFQPSDKGFAVSRSELNAFLREKLAQLGLNEQESKDFIEFWQPKMQKYPYYLVSFYGKREMDMLAPMTVTPQPDTVIRVFMDYRGLDKPIPTTDYHIRTPERRGFTVVEWGGVLHDR